jgi:hypothetical protein
VSVNKSGGIPKAEGRNLKVPEGVTVVTTTSSIPNWCDHAEHAMCLGNICNNVLARADMISLHRK